MVSKKKLATKAVMGFGVAMSAMYAAPELQADIVGLNFNPGSVPGSGVATIGVSTTGGAGVGSFIGWDTNLPTFFSGGYLNGLGQFGFGVFQSSSSVTSQFAGTNTLAFTAAQSGILNVGFTDAAGNHGWFQADLGAPGVGDGIQFGGGQYGNAGEAVHVGAIPEPTGLAGLAMLAIGAIGVRRNRKK